MDTLGFRGNYNEHENLYKENKKMLQALKSLSIDLVILSKRKVLIGGKHYDQDQLREYLNKLYDVDFDFRYAPNKATRALGDQVKSDYGLKTEEIIYIGNSKMDFLTAVNSSFLFLNACWHDKNNEYGFQFDSAKELSNFVTVFCLKKHYWQFAIDIPVCFRSMAVCATMTYNDELKKVSQSAIDSAKQGHSHKDFFLKQIVASVYFSGLFQHFDFVTAYPGHGTGMGNSLMEEILTIMGKFFKQKYIPDLIIRHEEAKKLQWTRKNYTNIENFTHQINTIHLNKTPKMSPKRRYKNFVNNIKGSTIMIVDDFSTAGTSFEAARAFIEKAGGKVILVSWLKFPNSKYNIFSVNKNFNPFIPNTFKPTDTSNSKIIPYDTLNVDQGTQSEFIDLYKQYCDLF